jgi:hypothetical protein
VRKPGGGLDDVLAVVQDEQHRPVRKRRDQSRCGVWPAPLRHLSRQQAGLAEAERAEHGQRYLRSVAQRRQLDEADIGGFPPGRLDRQPGLSGAAGSGEGDQARLAQQLPDPPDLLPAADKAGELGGKSLPDGAGGRGGVGGFGPEDGEMYRGQLGGRVGAEFLGQGPPRVLEGSERLGLLAAAVQRAYQLTPQPLPQRIHRDQLPQLRYQGAVLAELQPGRHAVLDGRQAQLIQARRLRRRERRLRHVSKRRPVPQVECLAQRLGGGGQLARGELVPPGGGEPLEPVRVDIVRVDRQPVTRRMELHQRAGSALFPQQGAEPGDLGLDRVRRTARRVVAVQTVDQPLHTDHVAGIDE